jgi:hypothetical protein
MTYYRNIPAGGDIPRRSAAQFRSNFTDLDDNFNLNHIGFSQAEDRGEHRRVTFNSVIVDPNAGDPKANLYIKTVDGSSELFFENFNTTAAANVVRQMTNLEITNLGNAGTAGGTLYRIDLPVNITIYTGVTNAIGASALVTFPVNYTTLYSASVTAQDANPQRLSYTPLATGLSIRTDNFVQVSWIAFGRI